MSHDDVSRTVGRCTCGWQFDRNIERFCQSLTSLLVLILLSQYTKNFQSRVSLREEERKTQF